MAAMNEHLSARDASPRRIVGLDIAPNMLAKAKERLGERPPFGFQLYDGLKIPFEDRSFDVIYSVACLQHVPRPYVFNLFFEIRRLLKPRGFAVLHFLSTDCLKLQEPSIRGARKSTTRSVGWRRTGTISTRERNCGTYSPSRDSDPWPSRMTAWAR
jgi:ubiquinone/menaquinone biosynthesis C-methylase UbiE